MGSTYGKAVIKVVDDSKVNVSVELEGVMPNSTYTIWINQSPGACPLPTFNGGTILSNEEGYGSAEVSLDKVIGATSFWVSAVGGGQVLRTSTVPVTAAVCNTLTDGTIYYSAGHYSAGQPIPLGYDAYGYNYQAHQFSGSYANVYLGGAGYPPYLGDDDAYVADNPAVVSHWAWTYRSTQVLMKWNDAWIANTDCDADGKLDRHYGYVSYIGSGAWETNHQWDSYIDGDNTYTWNYFTKIVAVPEDATKDAGIWYNSDAGEIGPDIWGEFAQIMTVYNDTGTGDHGIEYLSPVGPGFGKY